LLVSLPYLLLGWGFLKLHENGVKNAKIAGYLGIITGFLLLLQQIIGVISYYLFTSMMAAGEGTGSIFSMLGISLFGGFINLLASLGTLVFYILTIVILFQVSKETGNPTNSLIEENSKKDTL